MSHFGRPKGSGSKNIHFRRSAIIYTRSYVQPFIFSHDTIGEVRKKVIKPH